MPSPRNGIWRGRRAAVSKALIKREKKFWWSSGQNDKEDYMG